MNFLKIKYFIDVANYMSFTKAAQINYVTQAAISQQIAAMEKELGFKLFFRNGGQVILSPPGESFHNDCRDILNTFDAAVSRANKIHQKTTNIGDIKFGFIATTNITFMDMIINLFNKKYPHINVRLKPGSFVSIRQQMENGEMDLAMCQAYEMQGVKGIAKKMVIRQRVGFLVSRKNPLAQKDTINSLELSDAPTIMVAPEFAGKAYADMLKNRAVMGITPNIVEHVDSSELLTLLVSLNRGGAYLPEITTAYNPETCKLLTIEDSTEVNEIMLWWFKAKSTEPLAYLRRLIEEHFLAQPS